MEKFTTCLLRLSPKFKPWGSYEHMRAKRPFRTPGTGSSQQSIPQRSPKKSEVTACSSFNGHTLKDIPVINPGDWFGKTWLIEIGGSYWPLFLIVEADTIQDAIDELADNEKYGHNIIVADEDLADYDAETCNYGPSGQVIDLDHLMIHRQEGAYCPFPCRYFGHGLPKDGMKPTEFCCREDE